MNATEHSKANTVNKDLFTWFAAPYFVYVGIGALAGDYLSLELIYLLKIVLVVPILFCGRRRYMPLNGPLNPFFSFATGITAGILGAAAWVVCLKPFVGEGGRAWSETAFYLRLMAAGLVVPVFEEILMRGYVLRLAFQWDSARKAGEEKPFEKAFYEQSVLETDPGVWTWPAIIVSSVVFALGHAMAEWPAAIVYGLLMAALWIVRKDLLSCIVAHAATNIFLAFYVRETAAWTLW